MSEPKVVIKLTIPKIILNMSKWNLMRNKLPSLEFQNEPFLKRVFSVENISKSYNVH